MDGPSGWAHRIILPLVIFALALGARLVHLHAARAAGLLRGLFLDSLHYARQAVLIHEGHGAGDTPYLLSPLYPYVLALFVGPDGELDVDDVRRLQAVAGALTAALSALIAAAIGERALGRPAGRVAGWSAGLLTALHGPLIHFDATLLVASLQGLTLTTALWLLVGATEQQRSGEGPVASCWRRWATIGIVVGISAALRPTGLVVAAAIGAILLWEARRAFRGREGAGPAALRRGLAFSAGVVLVLLPFTIRNRVDSGEWVLLSANGGFNLWMGNHAGAQGVFDPPTDYDFVHDPLGVDVAARDLGHAPTYREASAWWRNRALADITNAPGRWLGLMGRKVLMLAHPVEIPQIGDNFQVHRAQSWPLRLPIDALQLLLLALAAPLALRAAADRWMWRELRWPCLFAGVYLATIALFFVTGRYRAPILPTVIVMGSLTLASLDTLRRRPVGGKALAGLGAVAILAAFTVAARTLDTMNLLPERAITGTGQEERHTGMALYRQGRFDEAVAAYRRALAKSPNDAITRGNLANALKALGRFDEAVAEYERVLAQTPEDGVVWYNVGNFHRVQRRDLAEAARCYREAIRLRPRMPEPRLNLGLVCMDQGRFVEAAEAFERFLQLAPPDDEHRPLATQAKARATAAAGASKE